MEHMSESGQSHRRSGVLPSCLVSAGTVYFLTDCDAFTRAWYKDTLNQEVSPTVMLPDDPLDLFRTTRRRCKASLGPPSPRTDDMARFNEARLGKPSNVLHTDSLRQFLVCSNPHLSEQCLVLPVPAQICAAAGGFCRRAIGRPLPVKRCRSCYKHCAHWNIV